MIFKMVTNIRDTWLPRTGDFSAAAFKQT